MRPDLSLLWTWNRTLDRGPYLVAGVALFLVKYGIDLAVARLVFDQPWTPWNYLIWPNDRTLRLLDLGHTDRAFLLTLAAVSIPFIWIGVMLTRHRLQSAGLPQWLVLLFFVPVVNLLLILMLVLWPGLPAALPEQGEELDEADKLLAANIRQSAAEESSWQAGLLAMVVSLALMTGLVALGANVLQNYGLALFVGSPFLLGMICVLLYGFQEPRPFGACIGLVMLTTTVAGAALLVFALEGAICLLMAAPLAYPLAFLGACVGFAMQACPQRPTLGLIFWLMVSLPVLMAAEPQIQPEPSRRQVVTAIEIDASPAEVWRQVIEFPPLEEPEEWYFRTGIAYPLRAEMHGSGPGAVRHCIFSTGTFVEPITVWQEPELLRFDVTAQPHPMQEWSPYDIHPPHLHGFLISHEGQFRLEELPDGRTRLEGTTWYTNRMWPAAYWSLWSDEIIHRIHLRVLAHIQQEAETP